MRSGIILAAFLVTGFTAVSPSVAHAEQYCGFINKPGAIVKCGYSSRESCENTIGKNARCFVDPDFARMDHDPLDGIKSKKAPPLPAGRSGAFAGGTGCPRLKATTENRARQASASGGNVLGSGPLDDATAAPARRQAGAERP